MKVWVGLCFGAGARRNIQYVVMVLTLVMMMMTAMMKIVMVVTQKYTARYAVSARDSCPAQEAPSNSPFTDRSWLIGNFNVV